MRAEMLNKRASDSKNKPNRVMQVLELKTGQNIADIGSGGGYYCLRFAQIVGKDGKIYAMDTDRKL